MPWQNSKDNMIDRFDGRAHLDIIAQIPREAFDEDLDREQIKERRHTNYERYRILIQNDFLKSMTRFPCSQSNCSSGQHCFIIRVVPLIHYFIILAQGSKFVKCFWLY